VSWTFVQATGQLFGPSGALAATGYAGNGLDKDNPAAQFVVDHGPLPVGSYTIEAPVDNTPLGPWALPLTPDADDTLEGRGGFFIHDDSLSHPGDASEGCIVLPGVAIRKQIWASGDHRLTVVEGPTVDSADDGA
jgi:hypothetical protein